MLLLNDIYVIQKFIEGNMTTKKIIQDLSLSKKCFDQKFESMEYYRLQLQVNIIRNSTSIISKIKSGTNLYQKNNQTSFVLLSVISLYEYYVMVITRIG